MNAAQLKKTIQAEQNTPGMSLISLEEDRILSAYELEPAALAAVLIVKAAFAGTIENWS